MRGRGVLKERACKSCKMVTTLEECPVCKEKTTTNWLGYVIVINAEKSKIAEKLGIKNKGKYALRVK